MKISKFLKYLFTSTTVCAFLIGQFSPVALAISEEQQRLLNKGIYYYNLGCAPTAENEIVEAGSGDPDGATFPNLNPAAMAQAINEYIRETNPDSKLDGLGHVIVASAKKNNISPFLIVGIAHKESSLASPSDYNVRNANNAFGRTATASQPNFQGARLWYKWSSVKASVDYKAPENQDIKGGGDIATYIRTQYADAIDSNNIAGFFGKYAPAFENDTNLYIEQVGKGIDTMVKKAQQKSANSPQETTEQQTSDLTNEDCCVTSDSEDLSVSGSNAKERIWNFLTGEMGMTANQAAGVMGNIKQESQFDPTALNPSSGAYGIVQWYAGRKAALQTYAANQGKPVSNLTLQLQFLKKELENDYYKPRVLDPIKSKDSLENATLIWLERFEIPCLPGSCGHEMALRVPFAQKIKEEFEGKTGASPSNSEDTATCKAGEGGGGTGASTGEFAWPIEKEVGIIFSCYGYARGRLHTGIDIAAPVGTRVEASDGGTVTAAGNLDPSGFGNTIMIKHPNGKWTLYAHMSSIKVRKGEKVDQGQEIGRSGGAAGAAGSGSSQGPHLHFNIQTEAGMGQGSVDPLKFLPKDGRRVNTSGGDCPNTAVFK